ncbi:MAG: hypothetical protein LBC77_05810 [Spirochaetaceae bacterium]|nr:hypothetical protein [Spirochaetaceae bacterium]
MKKLFLKLFLLALPCIIAPCLLDPYNVFHYKNVRDTGVESNRNYIKMRYILDNPDKFDSYLFGSSRVDAIDVSALKESRWYNMNYSSGLPKQHFENLEVLIHNKIIPDTVLIGVDDIACSRNPQSHQKQLLRMPYPKEAMQNKAAYFGFLINYFNPVTLKSLPIILSHKRENKSRFQKQFYENGGLYYSEEQLGRKPDWEKSVPSASPFSYGIDNAIRDIQSLIELCDKNNIKLIFFTNPLHKMTYEKAVEYGYIDFLIRLSDITDYYNFSGLNDITTNNDNYFETSHYKRNVGYLIIDTIFYRNTDPALLSQGFGRLVTAETRSGFFHLLRSQGSPDPFLYLRGAP